MKMQPTPLWTETNKTLFSSVFSVPPGKVCVLTAAGLTKEKIRTDATFIVPQAMCIRKILFGFDPNITGKPLPCGDVFDMTQVVGHEIVDQQVTTCGLPWQLTMCRNTAIIGIPGVYRLELNDSTAIGVAQAYRELYNVHAFPEQVQHLFL